MKGIIAEINGSNMIVIAKNGDFIKCRKLPNCNIGDEVNIPARNMSSIYKRISTVAASFIILAMLSTGVYAYYTPYSYVSVDINPSLELYVNRFDRVIGVHAFNEDAQKLLASSAGVKNKGIDTAIEQIIDKAADEGYLKQNEENSVMIVVSSYSKKEEAAISEKITKTSTAALSKVSSSYEVILEKTKVETYKKAKEDNVSPGKVILANEFKEVKPEINEEEIKRMPLQQAIKEIEKTEDDKGNGQGKADSKPKDKPKAAAVVEPPQKDTKNNVMNVKELIKEKNEELGKKLDKNKKDSNKDKIDEKDKESFKQNDNGSDKDKESSSSDKEQKDKEKPDKTDVESNIDSNSKEDKNSNKENNVTKENGQDSNGNEKKNK